MACLYALSIFTFVGCQQETSVTKDALEHKPIAEHLLGIEAQVFSYVDGIASHRTILDMEAADMEIMLIPRDERTEVHGFTSAEAYESWGDERGYEISALHKYEHLIHEYVEENNLTVDNVNLEEYNLFEQTAFAEAYGRTRPLPREVSGRAALGLLWDGCGQVGGATDFPGTKPFFSQRKWRNDVSSFTPAIGTLFASLWHFYDRSWFRQRMVTIDVVPGGEYCLVDYPGNANNRSNSIHSN